MYIYIVEPRYIDYRRGTFESVAFPTEAKAQRYLDQFPDLALYIRCIEFEGGEP